MGAWMVPLNIRWAVPELKYSLTDSGCRTLVFDKAFIDTTARLRNEEVPVEQYLFMGPAEDCPDWAESLEKRMQQVDPLSDLVIAKDGIAGIYYTGGTTGFPKGVIQTHTALFASSISVAAELDLNEDSVGLHTAPMFHMADLASNFALTIKCAKHVFQPAFDPAGFLDVCERYGVTVTILVPAMAQLVFDHPDFAADRLRSLDWLLYGGSPMPEGLVRRIMKTLPDLKLQQAYGQTELSPVATILKAADHRIDGDKAYLLRSAGQATSVVQLSIQDENNTLLPTGEIGEVCVRGPNAMLGYLNKPDATAETIIDGWVHTGDAGYLDEQGFLFIVDRTKDMIVSGGENVYSSEVESAASTHPDVAQVAVVGIPDDKWGEAVHAIVVPTPDAARDGDAIIAHCREMIAGYKCPKSIEFRDEALPLSGAGKVLKRELRAPFWEGRERGVN
jgi:acyl-CoA synthetase (AMP-forming)/AMP-acid ligase II